MVGQIANSRLLYCVPGKWCISCMCFSCLQVDLDQTNPRRSLQTALSMVASEERALMHSPALSMASPEAGTHQRHI